MARASEVQQQVVRVLKDCHRDGKSHTEIAVHIANATGVKMTKSAVSGMIYRLRLVRTDRYSAQTHTTPRQNLAESFAPVPTSRIKLPPPREPGPHSATLADLNGGCRYPVGQDDGADQLFCGEQRIVAQPYCPACMKIARPKWA